MVEFEDPITDTDYDPMGDPAGTAWKFIMVIGGITMTLLAFMVAQNNVLPTVTSFIGGLTGSNVGGNETVEVV
jgi:hypothetical protein